MSTDESIDPEENLPFSGISNPSEIQQTGIESFDAMNLKVDLWSRLYSYGFKMPSKVQEKVLMPLIQGRNLLVVQAKTEPGQVATYCSAIVQLFNPAEDAARTKFLILGCSTYLTTMVAPLLRDLAANHPHLEVWNLAEPRPRDDDDDADDDADSDDADSDDDAADAADDADADVDDGDDDDDDDADEDGDDDDDDEDGDGDDDDAKYDSRIPVVIVGWPDAVAWHMQKGDISLTEISLVVVDTSDSCINMEKEMRDIAGKLPRNFQFAVFSETMLGETRSTTKILSDRLEKSANLVEIVMDKEPVTTLEDMKHYNVVLETDEEEDNLELLSSMFDNWHEGLQCVVFVEHMSLADLILLRLRNKANVKAWGIRRNMDQEYRERVMKDYREGFINVLILTCYAARGFDVKVPVLINFDMSLELDEYREHVASFATSKCTVFNFTSSSFEWTLEEFRNNGVRFEVFPENFADVLDIPSSLQSHESHLGTEKNDCEMSFDEMNLKVELWSRLYSYGFKMPTKIQQRVLSPLIQGRNLLVQAKSEPGQVATYCSAIVQLFNYEEDDYTKYLILGCNTYLTAMVVPLLSDLAANLPPLNVWDLSKPIPDLDEEIQVIVGTPHQVWSQVQEGNISLGKISLVIVDEADSHINMAQEMCDISRELPEKFQFAVFSETMLGETMSTTALLSDLLEESANLLEIVMQKEPVTPLEDMSHSVVKLETYEKKMQLLSSIFDNWRADLQCVVFVKDFYWADHILLQLRNKANVKAWGIRGKMDQEYRDRVMEDYREGSINVLILTPYEARGFDVKVPKMINFDMRLELNDYRKKIASFGTRKGSVVNFVDSDDDWSALVEAGVHFGDFPGNFAD